MCFTFINVERRIKLKIQWRFWRGILPRCQPLQYQPVNPGEVVMDIWEWYSTLREQSIIWPCRYGIWYLGYLPFAFGSNYPGVYIELLPMNYEYHLSLAQTYTIIYLFVYRKCVLNSTRCLWGEIGAPSHFPIIHSNLMNTWKAMSTFHQRTRTFSPVSSSPIVTFKQLEEINGWSTWWRRFECIHLVVVNTIKI